MSTGHFERRRLFQAGCSALCFALILVTPSRAAPEKLKPADVVAKHLESIGSARARHAVKLESSQALLR